MFCPFINVLPLDADADGCSGRSLKVALIRIIRIVA